MSIRRARLLINTSNTLTLRISGEQIRLQVPPVRSQQLDRADDQTLNSWLLSGDTKGRSPRTAAANSRNWQLMTSGRSQMLATRNFEQSARYHGARWRRQQWTVAAIRLTWQLSIFTNKLVNWYFKYQVHLFENLTFFYWLVYFRCS